MMATFIQMPTAKESTSSLIMDCLLCPDYYLKVEKWLSGQPRWVSENGSLILVGKMGEGLSGSSPHEIAYLC